MPKERVRDKFWDINDPKNDIDCIEVTVPIEDFDKLIRKYAPSYIANLDVTTDDRIKIEKKKKRLIKKVFKGAAKTLTNRQFQIFVLRIVFGMKEVDIASQLGVNQSYIAQVLKVSFEKIRVVLRLTPKKKKKSKDSRKL